MGHTGRARTPWARGGILDVPDLREDLVEGGGHATVDGHGGLAVETALHQDRPVAVADKQRHELGGRYAGQHCRRGDLVSVQVEDGQDDTVVTGVEEFVRVPSGGRRSCLRLAVADDAGHDQVGVVERRSEGVTEGVAQLPSFVDRPWGLRAAMAGNAAGKRELAEEPGHTLSVAGHMGVALAVGAFQPGVGHDGRASVARAAHEDGIEILPLDAAAQVGVDEIEAGAGPPVAQQSGLDVLREQWTLEQRVVHEVDLARGQIVGRPEIRVEAGEFVLGGGGGRRHMLGVGHLALLWDVGGRLGAVVMGR